MFNRSNFKKLAAFLETVDDDQFNMNVFFRDYDIVENDYLVEGKTTCGTVACAAGWGPAAGILAADNCQYWGDYICDMFLDGEGLSSGLDLNPVYRWVFSEAWSVADNSPKGAAARIRWMLAGKPIDLPIHNETVEKYMKG
tara:strand:- start:1052 stop:1474 length:423 start_codon:yes stop_codon:yes gene_type:complete